jgi:transcriptional regulator
MYLPGHFQEGRIEVLHELMRTHPFGLLVTQGEAGVEANALPFLVDPARGPQGTLLAHVARANPVWQSARDDAEVLVVFQGPQAYISPNWYASKAESGKVVPTWNYVMVQARGRMRALEDRESLRGIVTQLTRRHEAAQPAPWAVDDAPAEFIDTMLGAIVGLEITLSSVVGKWKLSQNRPAADRDGVVSGLQRSGDAAQAEMAQWVRRAADQRT